ncbi:ABC transporter substrate-binding protein [Paenibacillus silvisoli]|uniref:ABC transporter substrate-binding protein n=1 Tax=Paenibacillus silvisoli TaxID=3110539 RepID=UPI0028057867|nr:extracellular solute-binding protein [Paenibacillus silvisoli]
MKVPKIVTLSAVSAWLAVSLAGCGNAPANDEPAASNQTKPADAAQKNESANQNAAMQNEAGNASGVEEKIDLAGRTIRIAANWDDSPKPDTATGLALIEKQKEVEQKYNVKIEYLNVPYDTFQEKFTSTVLAGEPFADIIHLGVDWALSAAAKNQLIPLNEFMDISASKQFVGFPALKGVEYGFNGPQSDTGGIFYNVDLVKKLGLTDPQDLFKQDKWNWDEFEKLAKQATQDTNNDGKPDSWGWSGWDAETAQFLIVSNDSTMTDEVSGKEMLSDPKTVEALEFLNRMHNVDRVVKVKSGDPDNYQERTTFADGDVLMTYGWGWVSDEYRKSNVNYGYVPFPKGPQAVDYSVPMSGPAAWFIPVGIKDPRIVADIYAELKDVPSAEEYPGQDWMEQKLLRQQDIDIFKEMVPKQSLIYTFNAYPDFPFYKLVTSVVKNQVSPATAVEQVKQQAQSSMDKILKIP